MRMLAKIPVPVAAAVLGTGLTYIHNGLKHGTLPFGCAAARNPERRGARHTYHISPKKFMEYTGADEDTLLRVAESIGEKLKFVEVEDG